MKYIQNFLKKLKRAEKRWLVQLVLSLVFAVLKDYVHHLFNGGTPLI
jgi:hypothetical protein